MAQLCCGPLVGRKRNRLVLDHEEHGSLKGQNSGPTANGPTHLWAINRLKDTPGREFAQHLNGSLKGRKTYILKICPFLEWAVNRPKPRRADIEPNYIAGSN